MRLFPLRIEPDRWHLSIRFFPIPAAQRGFDTAVRTTTMIVMRKILTAAAVSAALASAAAAEGEFRHVVLFKFKPEATADKVREIEKAFAELPSKIDTITSYEWGTSESLEGKNDGFTHCFFVSFKDKAGLETYIPHEAHQAFVAKLRPLLEKALVFDYTAKKD